MSKKTIDGSNNTIWSNVFITVIVIAFSLKQTGQYPLQQQSCKLSKIKDYFLTCSTLVL